MSTVLNCLRKAKGKGVFWRQQQEEESKAATAQLCITIKWSAEVIGKPESMTERVGFEEQGYDIITLEKMVDREYQLTEPRTAQEVIGYYARRIAEAVKLPAQFAKRLRRSPALMQNSCAMTSGP